MIIFGRIALVLTFYEGAKVFCAFQQEGAEAKFDLLSALIKGGSKTTIKFEDGTEFVFN